MVQSAATQYERFDYPGSYKRDAVGKPFTATRITALRHDACIAEVAGDGIRLQPGLSFTLTGHPREDLNLHWRVTRVHHDGAQQGTYYEQQAVLVPGRSEWGPAPLPKPRIDALHMATRLTVHFLCAVSCSSEAWLQYNVPYASFPHDNNVLCGFAKTRKPVIRVNGIKIED